MPLPQEIDQALRAIFQPQEINILVDTLFLRFVDFMKSAGPSLRPGIVGPLLRALQAPEPLVRRNAAAALSEIRDPSSVPALLNALRDSDDVVFRRAAQALERIRDAATMQGLCDLLHNPDPQIRINAIDVLVMIKGRERVAPLLVTLHDPDPEVRHFAAQCFIELLMHKAIVLGLVEALRDPVDYVRVRAARTLDFADDLEEVRQGLRDALRDPNTAVRYWAICGAARRRDRVAVAQLLMLLKDPADEIRREVARALGGIGDAAAVEQLLAALRSETIDEVRRSICCALREIAVATTKAAQSAVESAKVVLNEVLPTLNRVAANDPSKIVRIQALQIVVELEAAGNAESDADDDDLSAPLVISNKMLRSDNNESKQSDFLWLADEHLKLDTFCLVGKILYDDQKEVFKIADMRNLLEDNNCIIGDTTLRERLNDVRELFDEHLPDLGLVFDSLKGRPGYRILKPQWWVAWEIAMQMMGQEMPSGYVRPR